MLRQPAGAPRPNVVCSDAVTNVVVRPDRGALFCAVTYFGDEPLDAADDCDHDASPGYEEAIRRALAERYPALAGAAWQRAWAGPYDYSPDWNPIIGEAPGVGGLHLALAWSGHGFKLSPAVGEVVAAEVVGAEPRDRRDGAAADPLRRGQPPAPGLRPRRARLSEAAAPIGANRAPRARKTPLAACSAASIAGWWHSESMVAATREGLDRISAERRARWLQKRRRRRVLGLVVAALVDRRPGLAVWPRAAGRPRPSARPRRHGTCPCAR